MDVAGRRNRTASCWLWLKRAPQHHGSCQNILRHRRRMAGVRYTDRILLKSAIQSDGPIVKKRSSALAAFSAPYPTTSEPGAAASVRSVQNRHRQQLDVMAL